MRNKQVFTHLMSKVVSLSDCGENQGGEEGRGDLTLNGYSDFLAHFPD